MLPSVGSLPENLRTRQQLASMVFKAKCTFDGNESIDKPIHYYNSSPSSNSRQNGMKESKTTRTQRIERIAHGIHLVTHRLGVNERGKKGGNTATLRQDYTSHIGLKIGVR